MNTDKSKISYIEIDDPINQTNHAVEVYLTLVDGSKRWCFFHSPETIMNCGDYVDGTDVRMHFGSNHMFVVSKLSRDIIHGVLVQVDRAGRIIDCTRSVF